MFLNSIEIFGFKSFADKSRIPFDEGISVIVGPNGCGKSNVVDALRWVLGEQGAKGLRADKMAGVIFNGTDTRHPLNVAEVSLTFSNDKDILPLEFSEVEIKRRVFRNGTSEYYINKNQVTLRELRELLADTGVGSTDYVVMEQGRMDQILTAKPVERRQILEEAAGIVKHRMRSLEGTRRLEKVQENKNQLMQILKEVEGQHKILQDQCKKALTYRELKEKIFIYDVTRVCAQYNDMQNSCKQHNDTRTEKEKKVSEQIELIEKLTKDNEVFLGTIKKNEYSIQSEQEKISSIVAQIHGIEERIKKSEEYLETITAQLRIQESQLCVLQKKTHTQKKEKEALSTRSVDRNKCVTSIAKDIQTMERAITDVALEIQQHKESMTKTFQRETEIQKELERHQKDLRKVVDRLATELDKQLTDTGYSITGQKECADAIFENITRAIALVKQLSEKTLQESVKQLSKCFSDIQKKFSQYHKTQPIFLQDFLAKDGVLSSKHIIDKKISNLYDERKTVLLERKKQELSIEKLTVKQNESKEKLQSSIVQKASIDREILFLAEQEKRIEKAIVESIEQEKTQETQIQNFIKIKEQVHADIRQQKKTIERSAYR